MLCIDVVPLDLRQRLRQSLEHSGLETPFFQASLHDFQLPAVAACDRENFIVGFFQQHLRRFNA